MSTFDLETLQDSLTCNNYNQLPVSMNELHEGLLSGE